MPDFSNFFLETERLKIRRFTEKDLDNLYSLLSDKEVMKYYPKPLSRVESEHWLKSILEDYKNNGVSWWAIFKGATGEFVGQVGILLRPIENTRRYMLAYMLKKEFWSRGYASEAVEKIIDYVHTAYGIDDILCLVRPVNIPSIRLAEKLGFEYERTVDYKGYEHRIYRVRTSSAAPGSAAIFSS
jgi:[ribosomal protein S5]-alanine N-acetyltransferase